MLKSLSRRIHNYYCDNDICQGLNFKFDKTLNAHALQEKFKEIKTQEDLCNKSQDVVLRVVSYNIHMFYSPRSVIINTLRELDADVLVLLEATKRVNGLKELYPYVYYYPLPGSFFGNAVCSKVPLSVEPNVYSGSVGEQRSFLDITFTFQDVSMQIIGTHLDVWDNTGKERRNQIEQLVEYVNKNGIDNTIIVGDFNAVRRENYSPKHLKWLIHTDKNRGIDTPFFELDPLFDSGWIDLTPHNCISTWSLRKVDFGFAKPLQKFQLKTNYLYDTHTSDHFPMVIDFVNK